MDDRKVWIWQGRPIVSLFQVCLIALLLVPLDRAIGQVSDPPMLMRQPTLSDAHIAFILADDLWIVDRAGGDARRLTSSMGSTSHPRFSPDGTLIAFTAAPDGNKNIYVLPVEGGPARRVTYYPGHDFVTGWTPDGSRILFESTRQSHSVRYYQLFTVPVEGGLAEPLPFPMGFEGTYSPDGTRVAYTPIPRTIVFGGGPLLGWQHARWKNYRGGLQPRIWLADLEDSRIEQVPRDDTNDFNPMWIGEKVFFLSDRVGHNTLFEYDIQDKAVRQVLPAPGNNIESASAGPGGIVYEQPGSIRLLELPGYNDRAVPIRIAEDFPQVQPRLTNVGSLIRSAELSPDGSHALFEARGEVLLMRASDGQVDNLTGSPGAADRDAVWSPDGRSIAYFSDQSGDFMLHVQALEGASPVRRIALLQQTTHFFRPKWSPDSRKLLFMQGRHLWYVDVMGGAPVKIASDTFHVPITEIDQRMTAAWSPDSKWIAYSHQGPNRLRVVSIYSLDTGRSSPLTEGWEDAGNVAFDPLGEYLYFTASTDLAAKTGWLEMSFLRAKSTATVRAVMLRADSPSPLQPLVPGQEVSRDDRDPGEKRPFRIDLEGIKTRIVTLSIPARNFVHIAAPSPGKLVLLSGLDAGSTDRELSLFDVHTGETQTLQSDVMSVSVSAEGQHALVRRQNGWTILALTDPSADRAVPLSVDALQVRVDPREEWRQIFREAWQTQRDSFYAENVHGADLTALESQYEKFLTGLGSREDLNYLLTIMMGDLAVGHLFILGGDIPISDPTPIGMLGADFTIREGLYVVDRVYGNPRWSQAQSGPLTHPGAVVHSGEFLLEIAGRPLSGDDDIYQRLIGQTGKPLVLRVGPNANGHDSRSVTVVPVASEFVLRDQAWIDENIRRVAEATDGRVAYVYLLDTGVGGMRSFDQLFFPQADREAIILDVRFNSGGQLADYVLRLLQQEHHGFFYSRDARPMSVPVSAIHGPKAMLINQYSASGGDYMPWAFRRDSIGTLVGQKTWGGLVGIVDSRQFIDGGMITVPEDGFFTPEGAWEVENAGVAPDLEIELDPYTWRRGRDAQLEAAIEEVLERLDQYQPPGPRIPPFPDYSDEADPSKVQ